MPIGLQYFSHLVANLLKKSITHLIIWTCFIFHFINVKEVPVLIGTINLLA